MSYISGRYLSTVTVDFEKDIPEDEKQAVKDRISSAITGAIAACLYRLDVNITGITIQNEYCHLREGIPCP